MKPWLEYTDSTVYHLPFPEERDSTVPWSERLNEQIDALHQSGVPSHKIAAVFIETLQGWGALPLPVEYVQALRAWADQHGVLLVFDEIQTGFGRTGKLFAHEHYGVEADMICIGKGVTSSLPLAALLGPSEVLDVLPPGEVTTTHAAHPMSCTAALANLRVLRRENLIEEAARKGEVARNELLKLAARFPKHVDAVRGLGLLQAIHLKDPRTGLPSRRLAADLTWESVKQGVMLFQTNRATVKICPPLVTPDAALVEGIHAIGDALNALAGDS